MASPLVKIRVTSNRKKRFAAFQHRMVDRKLVEALSKGLEKPLLSAVTRRSDHLKEAGVRSGRVPPDKILLMSEDIRQRAEEDTSFLLGIVKLRLEGTELPSTRAVLHGQTKAAVSKDPAYNLKKRLLLKRELRGKFTP